MIIQPIAGVNSATSPNALRPIVVTEEGHLLVDVAGVIDVTIENVDQGDPNSIPNAWPVKITDGTNVLGTTLNPLVISDGGTAVTVTVDGAVTVTGSVSITGSVDTELPAAVLLGDTMANPTAPSVGSHMLAWDATAGEWERVQSAGGAPRFAISNSSNTVQATVAQENDASSNGNQQLYTASYLRGFNGATWDRLRTQTQANPPGAPLTTGVLATTAACFHEDALNGNLVAAHVATTQADATINTGYNGLVTSSLNYGFNGTTFDRLRSDITNGLDVDVTRVSGTVTVSGVVLGNIAHDAVDSGNPIKIGGKVNGGLPTAVATGDRVDAWFGTRGQLNVQIDAGGGAGAANVNGTSVDGAAATAALHTKGFLHQFNGSTWDRVYGDISNGIDVDVTRISGLVTTSGVISGTVAVTNTALSVVGGGAQATAQRVTLANDSTGVVGIVGGDMARVGVTSGGALNVNIGSASGSVSQITNDSDDQSQSNRGLNTASFNYGYDGATWDRIRSYNPQADIAVTETKGALSTIAKVYGDDQVGGTGSILVAALATNADASVNTLNGLVTASFGYGFNGTTWDRIRAYNPQADIPLTEITGALSTIANVYGNDHVSGTGSLLVSALAVQADSRVNTINSLVVSTLNYGFNGVTWDRLRSDLTNGLDVDVTRVSGTVTVGNSGTFAVQVTSLPTDTGLTNQELRGAAVPITGMVSQSGVWNITDISGTISLPTGAATASKQDTLLAELQLKADLTETQPVSIAGTVATSNSALLTELQLKADLSETQPVSIAGTVATSNSTLLTELQLKADLTETQPVSLASVPSHAVTNAGTFAVQAAAQPGVDVGDVTINNAAGAAAVNVQDGGNSLTVDGTFWQATQPVSGTFFQATQPVSIATVPSHPVTNAGTFAVQVTSLPTTDNDSLTNAELRGAPVVITGQVSQSGTWNIGTVSTITNVVHIDDNAGSITVDGAVSISGPVSVTGLVATSGIITGTVTVDTELEPVMLLTDNHDAAGVYGNPVGSFLMGYNSFNDKWKRVKINTSDQLNIAVFGGDGEVVTGNVESDNNSAGSYGLRTQSILFGYNGTSYDRLRSDIANGLDVDVTRVSGTVTTSGVVDILGTVTVDGTVEVTGVSTAAKQDILLTELQLKADLTETQPVSLASVPSHAVTNIGTFATQVTSISAGDNNIGNMDIVSVPAPLSTTGGGTEATALRVTFANDSTGLISVDDNGSSLTVDGTFWQATQPISAASLPLPTGASTSALQTQPGVDIGDVTINNAAGAAGVNIQDGGNSITVDGTITIDNASGVNALFIQDGGNSLTVDFRSENPTLTNIASSASSVNILAQNTLRKGAMIFNDSTNTLYLKWGAVASTTSFTVMLVAGAYYEVPFGYVGMLDGIWAAANGFARVTEVT